MRFKEDSAAESFKFHLRRIVVVAALDYSANGAFSRSDTIRTLTATRSALVGPSNGLDGIKMLGGYRQS
ncbi:hypothetical protein M404DRAFT_17670 [Pisolithus tinctorius Marx 270]|uniref:Uncharacterized protein n=1 Tax=Pisolithus tinctorius Marx 270 TaxID=870435 RepID=A0A0C3PYQ0_PISTI|nr:hypothetical protein M404DRAFT_17670 [Pisolithus tinctorius Marx 270]